MEWMLDIQLGRRNLSPIQRIAVAEKYRPIYEKQALINKQVAMQEASKLGIKYSRKNTKYVYKNGNNYEVHFVLNGEMLRFGNFKNKEEAIRVAMEKAKEYGKGI